MLGQYDLRSNLPGALDGVVKVLDLEPEKHAIAIGAVAGVPDRAMIMLDLETVKLQDEAIVPDEPLIVAAAMVAAAVEQPLIPSAARFDIRDGDQGLCAHQGPPFDSGHHWWAFAGVPVTSAMTAF